MSFKKIGKALLVLGTLGVISSLIVDAVGIGKEGVQALQLLGIQAGIVIATIGIGFLQMEERKKISVSVSLQNISGWITGMPTIIWVLAGFLIVYISFFILPALFNPDHRIQYFSRYIPEITPIGRDLAYNTNSIKVWLSGGGLYDVENHFYPPLYAVVFSPLLLLSYPTTYYVISGITIGCLTLSVLVIPALIAKKDVLSLSAFFFITVIFSYGMLFELERGQFNVITLTLCLLAAYLYHYQRPFRHLAYLLFSVAVQIKIYPAIFILMFVDDWRAWKNNIVRFVGLGLFNLALLFSLGVTVFADFIKTLPILTGATWIRPYNHSIKAFADALANSSYGNIPAWISGNASIIEGSFYAVFFLCLFMIMARAYRMPEKRIDPDLFLVCIIGSLVIPSVSIDYKLPLLAPALVLSLHNRINPNGWKGIVSVLLVILISSAYSITLVPFVYRTGYLASSFPLLMIILVAATFLNNLTPLVVDESRNNLNE